MTPLTRAAMVHFHGKRGGALAAGDVQTAARNMTMGQVILMGLVLGAVIGALIGGARHRLLGGGLGAALGGVISPFAALSAAGL